MGLWLAAATAVFVLNTAYLSASASASFFYFANVVLHMALGLGLAVVLGRRLADAWRRNAASAGCWQCRTVTAAGRLSIATSITKC